MYCIVEIQHVSEYFSMNAVKSKYFLILLLFILCFWS